MRSLSRHNWLFFSSVLMGMLLWGTLTFSPHKKDESNPQEDTPFPLVSEASSSPPGWITQQNVIMGSECSFLLRASKEVANPVLQKIVSRLQQLESQLAAWHPGSDIAQINDHAGIAPTVVHPETFKLLSLAQHLYQSTGGIFDPSMGGIKELWSFHPPQSPHPEVLKTQLTLRKGVQINLDEKNLSVTLSQRGIKIDLEELGRGYAAQVAIQMMKESGIQQAAIQIEGGKYLLGKSPTGAWEVTVEAPQLPGKIVERFIAQEGAVVNVGRHEDYFVKDGKWFSRILDPKTGYPVANDNQSVTILSKDFLLAETYAKIVFLMGTQAGLAWIEKQAQTFDLAALIIDVQGQRYLSSKWRAMAQSLDSSPQPVESSSPPEIHQSVSPLAKKSRIPPKSLLGQLKGRSLDLQTGDMIEIPGESQTSIVLIDKTEVSNQQYQRFLEATVGHPHEFCHPDEPIGKDHTPRYWREYRSPLFRNTVAVQLAPFHQETFKHPNHPVVGIDWWDAYSFARWAGKRLPTQEEWKRSACGTDGRLWPWGNQWDNKKANTGGEKWNEQDGFTYSAPTVSFLEGASPYQGLNMAGNVSEWTQEGFVMGGSSKSSPTGVSCYAKNVSWEPEFRSFDIGFRCAAEKVQ